MTLRSVLLSPKLLPLAKSAGLPLAMDLRGKFTGWPAVKIYDWARTTFFEKCSKHVIVWLGGACGDVIHPAVADWGVSQRAFFSDLVRESMRFRFDLACHLAKQTATVCRTRGPTWPPPVRSMSSRRALWQAWT